MNIRIKFIKKPRLNNVCFIAAWPGMGDVAIKAINSLKKQLKFEQFAILNTPEFFPAHSVEIKANKISIPKSSGGKFYFYKNKSSGEDIILFINDRQPPPDLSYEYAEKVLEITRFFNIKCIFTFAAIPAPIEHRDEPRVFTAATKKGLLNKSKIANVKTLPVGQISGLNGLLLGVADVKNIEGICILSEIPLYAMHIENPRASVAVLKVLSEALNIEIRTDGLIRDAKLLEEEIDKFVDYLKVSTHAEPIDEEDIEKIRKTLASCTKLPPSAKKNIEGLFYQVKKDISKANFLKNELDKWNVYEEYEDRFLDLFRKIEKEDN